ncbi:MAG: DUF4346 domain-containing protein [Desulfobulbaceae bacterium]|nr:DUF4346 domain-containing protein [Desulfobulbaceae bacterium]
MPVPAYNRFRERIDALDALSEQDLSSVSFSEFSHEKFSSQAWPVQPGDFRVYNARGQIAIALIAEPNLPDFLADENNVAIVGSLTTENIGVEYILKNINANPYIRDLVLIGSDISGHYPGDALCRLMSDGLSDTLRIRKARGARPVLKNTTLPEVEHLQRQVTLHNYLGKGDSGEVLELFRGIKKKNPFSTGIIAKAVEPVMAHPARRLRLDPNGYFIIIPRPGGDILLHVEHYQNNGKLKNVIEGNDASSICSTIIDMGLVSQLDHAAYLGRELARAERAAQLSKPYVQDQAQGTVCS